MYRIHFILKDFLTLFNKFNICNNFEIQFVCNLTSSHNLTLVSKILIVNLIKFNSVPISH